MSDMEFPVSLHIFRIFESKFGAFLNTIICFARPGGRMTGQRTARSKFLGRRFRNIPKSQCHGPKYASRSLCRCVLSALIMRGCSFRLKVEYRLCQRLLFILSTISNQSRLACIAAICIFGSLARAAAAGKDDHPRWHTLLFECIVEFIALRDRNACVGIALLDPWSVSETPLMLNIAECFAYTSGISRPGRQNSRDKCRNVSRAVKTSSDW